ncbi:NADH dehydrogenase [ubiquinone] 1 beta subcomplex subunit 8, mitochondrial-like [Teleopsis dalmanni]|uniref:NADH dehydrogenase [ubiquinone] 1 beta subcomplex subunit 8, mitochondrial-like n=1 Tax=Teleopsis dalmanni TaxID=139649 RepID=UPI0018CE766B|nr:NADH dehydrogenase [ubiquinone] 1 beta subcomplex subunit 8, mitochondrial-like [Teleopsis dalmanni]XP_037939701.1 NADH dehydrogenase [ubiquinone] 1 beta subcomplex subunit 8, mitochondrial-like [Teleopsis dalmanni]
MALINSLRLVQKLNGANAPLLLNQMTRNLAHWNKDFKPGPYPTTQKERDEAARKYNIAPEDYKPYPDDGLGYGDYPKLEIGLGVEARDPYYPYDFPEHKRNFNEPIHADIDLYGEDRYSVAARPRYSNQVYWGTFLGVMTFCFVLYYWLEDKKMFRPVSAKQYPGDGKKHYTFENE